MTVLNEIEDLKDVIAWAEKQSWVKNISLVGHSQGGVVLIMIRGISKEIILNCLILLRQAFCSLGRTMWRLLYIFLSIYLSIYETAANYNGPTLIVQGTHDQIVPYTYAERYNEKIKNSKLILVPDENHVFSKTQKDTSIFNSATKFSQK